MFNLYTNAIDPNGFMGLVSKNINANDHETEVESRKIITGFALASVLIISLIANGSLSQQLSAVQKNTAIASYATLV